MANDSSLPRYWLPVTTDMRGQDALSFGTGYGSGSNCHPPTEPGAHGDRALAIESRGDICDGVKSFPSSSFSSSSSASFGGGRLSASGPVLSLSDSRVNRLRAEKFTYFMAYEAKISHFPLAGRPEGNASAPRINRQIWCFSLSASCAE